MKARVTVTLKSGILDPQGKAIEGALKSLGVDGVASVRQGKVFDIELSGADKAKAEAALKDAADKSAWPNRHRKLPGSSCSRRSFHEICRSRFSRNQSRARYGARAQACIRP